MLVPLPFYFYQTQGIRDTDGRLAEAILGAVAPDDNGDIFAG